MSKKKENTRRNREHKHDVQHNQASEGTDSFRRGRGSGLPLLVFSQLKRESSKQLTACQHRWAASLQPLPEETQHKGWAEEKSQDTCLAAQQAVKITNHSLECEGCQVSDGFVFKIENWCAKQLSVSSTSQESSCGFIPYQSNIYPA